MLTLEEFKATARWCGNLGDEIATEFEGCEGYIFTDNTFIYKEAGNYIVQVLFGDMAYDGSDFNEAVRALYQFWCEEIAND